MTFSKPPSPRNEHTVTLTPKAADQIRRIAAQQRFDPRLLWLIVFRNEHGMMSLDLSEDESEAMRPDKAVASSQGVSIVIPRQCKEEFADLLIDCLGGAFKFSGSAVPESAASHPGRVALAAAKLLKLNPELRGNEEAIELIGWHLMQGDSRAAVVMSTDPLVIAAYTDELDCVALLMFPQDYATRYGLKPGHKMLTVNTYSQKGESATDIVQGARASGRFVNFTPLIAEFLTTDAARVNTRKREIDRDEWERTLAMGKAAMERAGGIYRDGRPPNSGQCAY